MRLLLIVWPGSKMCIQRHFNGSTSIWPFVRRLSRGCFDIREAVDDGDARHQRESYNIDCSETVNNDAAVVG